MTLVSNLSLLRDKHGLATIELAMILPVLAIGIVGIVDTSNAYSRKLALEQGAQRAVEKIMQTTEDDTVEGTLATEAVCQVNGKNEDGSCRASPITTTDVTVTWRLECKSTAGTISAQTTTDSAAFDLMTCATGTVKEARYVQVEVRDKYTPMFRMHFGSINGDGTYHLSAIAGMRTQ